MFLNSALFTVGTLSQSTEMGRLPIRMEESPVGSDAVWTCRRPSIISSLFSKNCQYAVTVQVTTSRQKFSYSTSSRKAEIGFVLATQLSSTKLTRYEDD